MVEERHKRIYRDNIQGFTKPVIARMIKSQGIERVSFLIYENYRYILTHFMKDILRLIHRVHSKSDKKLITSEEVMEALNSKYFDVLDKAEVENFNDTAERKFYIPLLSFKRMVLEFSQDYVPNIDLVKFKKGAINTLQFIVELFIKNISSALKEHIDELKVKTLRPEHIEDVIEELGYGFKLTSINPD